MFNVHFCYHFHEKRFNFLSSMYFYIFRTRIALTLATTINHEPKINLNKIQKKNSIPKKQCHWRTLHIVAFHIDVVHVSVRAKFACFSFCVFDSMVCEPSNATASSEWCLSLSLFLCHLLREHCQTLSRIRMNHDEFYSTIFLTQLAITISIN